METSIFLSFIAALLSFSFAPTPGTDPAPDTLSEREISLYTELCQALRADGYDLDAEVIRIEFEYHDLFVDEEIPARMAVYQSILAKHGVQPGSQRQIHLLTGHRLLIGDFDGQGRMIGSPVRV